MDSGDAVPPERCWRRMDSGDAVPPKSQNLFNRLLQGLGFVGPFPREGVEVVHFAEMAVVGRLAVDRAQQVQLLDDVRGLEAEDFAGRPFQCFMRTPCRCRMSPRAR